MSIKQIKRIIRHKRKKNLPILMRLSFALTSKSVIHVKAIKLDFVQVKTSIDKYPGNINVSTIRMTIKVLF